MRNGTLLLIVAALVAGALLAAGCTSSPESTDEGNTAANMHSGDSTTTPEAHGDFANPVAGTCPVSGEEIDPNVVAEVDGKRYALCCEGCREDFLEDPAQFLTGTPAEGGGHDMNGGH